MHQVLHSLNKFVVYFDDILVYSISEEDHYQHLKLVFKALEENGLYINMKKCTIWTKKISFEGFIINNSKVQRNEVKVETITDWPIPKSKKEVQAFVGLTSFYIKFIKTFGSITTPITNCLKKKRFL